MATAYYLTFTIYEEDANFIVHYEYYNGSSSDIVDYSNYSSTV